VVLSEIRVAAAMALFGPETENAPEFDSRGISLSKDRAAKILRENGDHAGFAYNFSDPGSAVMPGNVSLPMTIPADEPLLVNPVGMLGNAWEVYRFICSPLLCHHLTALFAFFHRHCLPPAPFI
jgi:hypothetical protein